MSEPAKWTPEQAAIHLRETFNQVCQHWPDLMEPYVVQLAEAPENEIEIMRRGLRETIKKR